MVAFPTWCLIIILVISALILGRTAEVIVESALAISKRWQLSQAVVGATIVSLGTTFPELVVSALSALQNQPALALGNAVGSVICDTGLIMGLGILIGNIPSRSQAIQKAAWLQFALVFVLIMSCLPFAKLSSTFSEGGSIHWMTSLVFGAILVLYLRLSLKRGDEGSTEEVSLTHCTPEASGGKILLRMGLSFPFLFASSEGIILTVKELALRAGIPESYVAVTIVALGTSLPELITALSAIRVGAGELALGNIIGADILNILLVAGSAIFISFPNLPVEPDFFRFSFPFLIIVTSLLRLGLSLKTVYIPKIIGLLLLLSYLATLILPLVA